MRKHNKIAIIGLGHVGAHCAYALIMRGLADELVFVDINREKAVSERQDLIDCIAFAPHNVKISIADYEDLGDCDLIVNSVGNIAMLKTHNRLEEMAYTLRQVDEYIPRVMAGGFHGIIINISNPCDVITKRVADVSGLPMNHVFGTGTGLDTSRLLGELSRATGVDHKSISGYMMGEHGASIMFPKSRITFNGEPISVLEQKDEKYRFDYETLKQQVHDDAWITYEGKRCTEYGICTVLARIVEAVLHDEKTILPVSACLTGQYGRSGLYIGVPAVIGEEGVEHIPELDLPDNELQLFRDCCDSVLRNIETGKQYRLLTDI